MFAALGEEADFCRWVVRLGGQATLAAAAEASAAGLGTPLEGIASVPVTSLESGGCTVHGRRALSGRTGQDRAALAAAFCVAFLDGEAPVEAAGRAALVAAR